MTEVSADNRLEFDLNVARLLRHEVPAFIVYSHPQRAHVRHLALLISSVGRLFPDLPASHMGWTLSDVDQRTIGTLHHDMPNGSAKKPTDILTLPSINTPLTGGGEVRMAHIGTNPVKAYTFDNVAAPLEEADYDNPHEALLRGEADPTIISPDIFVGRITVGRSVISSGDSGRFATWHRYDTDAILGVRSVQADSIMTRDEYEIPLGYDL